MNIPFQVYKISKTKKPAVQLLAFHCNERVAIIIKKEK
jgi:hypothetical protein